MIRTGLLRRLTVALLLAAAGAVSGTSIAHADPTGDKSDLTAVTGQGVGQVIVSPTTALGHGTFEARVTVNIHETTPDTTFTVTRAADPTPDGVCTNTVFGTVATLHTSSGGAGAVEFERTGPLLKFDLLVRVVGDDGTVLQSECMTITAK
jgi:hypothetical protein